MRKPFKHWFWGRLAVLVVAPLEILIQTIVGAIQGFLEGVDIVYKGLRR